MEHQEHRGRKYSSNEEQGRQDHPGSRHMPNKEPDSQDVHGKLTQIANEDHDLDPYEIEFKPEFREGRGPEKPFVNEYGVVIGDHMYDSPDSPLNLWSKDTDPEVMSGDQWVHPYKDIGFHTEENRDLFERGIPPQGGMFMHPDKDVAYEVNAEGYDGQPAYEERKEHESDHAERNDEHE